MNQSNLLTVRVAGVMNRQAVVLHAGRTLPCLLSGRLLRQKDSLAVGDRAEAEVLGGGQYRLTRILPRTSALRRPSRRGSGDALLAANVDFVLADLKEHHVENILALRGDVNPDVPPKEDFAHASDLVAYIRASSDLGVSAACYPEGHLESPDLVSDIRHLKEKVEF